MIKFLFRLKNQMPERRKTKKNKRTKTYQKFGKYSKKHIRISKTTSKKVINKTKFRKT